ncbi:hypothetical protein [Arcanobacterium haemolyticum]|uniref:Uncharacterized protein n=1 Tax=Arcanobacterium haemolyticum (strain ATCC 9345 / DSM 20595 / CCM 5947 / CCUG 17215 / LMG 16163 / NBRC 15585 / NCTC 8452 / 11018) TaxID=644284 RepID=D7BMF9_ARCHD|nr:hypothetical protein [Arcanobacterium haemolyticum]ADH92108.1 hypothetical protein Arch_0353 [Arcanobacterium haemolyticum DSM 20595]SQH29187.1 Uncharacterised protein [Arcanobacterium haemolyticum]
MMQLIGYHAWRAGADRDQEAASVGIKRARAEMISRIRDLTYRELSEGDISFVNAMLVDGKQSSISAISKWDVAQIMSHSIAGGF